MAERVRLRKKASRSGSQNPVSNLSDDDVIEGLEISAPNLGSQYMVRGDKEMYQEFTTGAVRAIVTDSQGILTLVTDDSVYAIEIVGH